MASGSLKGLTDAQAARLAQIYDEWNRFPGRAPGGSGETGLAPNDAKGYSDLLNEQTEGLDLENAAQGKAPMRRSYGGEIASQGHGIADDPEWQMQSGPYGTFGTGTGGNVPTGSGALEGLQAAAAPKDLYAVKPKKYTLR